jgi:hypothetical protein
LVYTFKDLPKYIDSVPVTYSVTENTVTGYRSPVIVANGNNTFTITNKLATTSVKVTKIWDDDSNRDGIRPDIEVKLMADNHDGSELLEVATCTLSAEDAVVDEDGTTDNNTWSYTFDKLPIYHYGVKIDYSVVESAIEDGSLKYYETTYEPESAKGVVSNEETDNVIDFTITNTHEVFRTFVTATKTWDDADDQDGKRPDEITLHLWKNKGIEGSEEEVDHATVTPDEDGNWTYTFDNLYKNEDGNEIVYTIEEDGVDNYELISNAEVVDDEATGDEFAVDGGEVGLDDDELDGVEGIVEGDDEIAGVDDEATEAADTEKGHIIALTNMHEPSIISINVSKVWNDSDNLDGSRPDSVTVQLLANGEALEGKTLTLNEANGWDGTFADLPEYANGEKIVYTIEEAAVEGYTTEITGSADEGFVITNSHEPVVEVVTTAQTGDNSNILLWMLSPIISGLTLVGAWIARRRRLA